MRKSQTFLICAACLFFVTSAKTAQKAKSAMTNADVIQMVSADLSEQVIITSIRQAPTRDFNLNPTGLIALKKAGVSDKVIQVMQEVSTPAKSGSAAADKVPADDREQTVNAVLRQAVMAQSRGALSLSSFQKTNGYEQDVTKMYVLEWQAEILFEQAGYKAGNAFVGYWQDFRVLQQQPGTLDSLVVGNTIHFNKGARIRLTGDSTFRKTEQGWRLEGLKTGTAQVVAESGATDPPPSVAGSTAAASSDNSPVPKTTTATGARNLEELSAAFDKGEEVVFKIKYYSSGNLLTGSPGMPDGLVTVSKTGVGFQPTAGAKGFSVSPDKILDVINEQPLRVRLKVAIKNTKGDKEDKKEFQFFHPSAFMNGIRFYCTGCDASMNVLFAFLQHARGKI
ncbi:MAG: hypothetical protein QOH41_254 [Blastocatellia bacterium]|nr:hypothetical protein [Blastocatellia bacterium]